MLKPLRLNIKKLPSSLFCVGITAVLLLALWWSGFFFSLDMSLYDLFLGLAVKNNPRALHHRVVPVDLDDRSEMKLGERLEDRSAFGDIFSSAAHSRARVSLDFIFRGERENDSRMLDAAAGVRGLFIALVPVPEGRENISFPELREEEQALIRKNLWRPKEFGSGNIPRAVNFVMPFFGLAEQAVQLAHISVEPDPDGIYRRTPLFYAWEDGYIPTISLATALWDLNVDGNDIEIYHGKKVVIPLGPGDSISIPIDSYGNVLVPFGGLWEHTRARLSFERLADSWYDEKELNAIFNSFKGSIFFVADTTFAMKDIGPIPMENFYPLSGLHTWVLSGILDASLGNDTFIREAPLPYRLICIALFALVFVFLGMVRKDWIFNTVSAVLFLGFSGMNLYLWFFLRIMPWYCAGAAEILLTWFLGFIYRFLTQKRRQTAMERYVPRPVAQKLVAGERISLSPIHKELTIVFSDIKAFTTWSADKDARSVHDFLNDYLESMADILFSHGGTIDKFMGDGLLAFFGDPLDIPNHAEAAVKAAIAMQNRIRELAEMWKPRVGIDLKVRIGLNTGRVIVGDLGIMRRIEYTVIGSAVNLAQRMEGLASPGGILVTEFTKTAVEQHGKDQSFSFGGKRDLDVKGYDKPIATYDVIWN